MSGLHGDTLAIRSAGQHRRRAGIDSLSLYNAAATAKLLDQAVDGVFWSSKRPVGFCQNPHRGCSKKVAAGKCDVSDNHNCILTKPDRLFLLYQAGEREEDLHQAFAHAPLAYRISVEGSG